MPIKLYRSDQVGAPALSGTNGTLIAVLDACLVNGFGQVNVATLTRVGNVVTAGFIAPHNLNTYDWATLAGADQAGYNGEHQVTRVDALTLTFEVQGEPVTPGTGTITMRRAPAGFAKPFAATNKAVYRSTDPSSRRHFFRVVDDGTSGLGARAARIRGFETMAGVDDGALPFPPWHLFPNDGFWLNKSNFLDAYARAWIVVSDGKTVYLMISGGRGPADFADDSYAQLNAFGEYSTFVPDAYASFVSGMEGEDQNSSNCGVLRSAGTTTPSPQDRNCPVAVARMFNAAPGSYYAVAHIGHGMNSPYVIGERVAIPYPNLPDNRYYLTPVLMYDPGGYLRAQLPGAYESLHGRTHTQGRMLENVNVVGKEKHRFVYLGGRGGSTSYLGGIFVDLTGPWEVS